MTQADANLSDHVNGLVWYHTIDLGNGLRTPGIFEMSHALERVPLPASLAGRRCLDVGTADGFWAFEMERRGADEVVAVDLGRAPAPDLPHYPVPVHEQVGDPRPFASFELAHEALGSSVDYRAMSVYDLTPEALGEFDFVFLGSLLLHVRDPLRALASVRRVTAGDLLVNDAVTLGMSRLRPFAPVARMVLALDPPTWWAPNAAGLRRMVESAGYSIVDSGRPYRIGFGEGLRVSPIDLLPSVAPRPLRTLPGRLVQRADARLGVPHVWIRARPRTDGLEYRPGKEIRLDD
jgi:tRNA (mo5U34)-methyltransferase